MIERLPTALKPPEWMGSSLDDLRAFPEEVKDVLGYALYLAQIGSKHPDAKPLTGDKAFRGAGVLEMIDRSDGDTYRAVYTVKFSGAVYVLHAFQKKAKKGIATPRADIELIKRRLRQAQQHYAEHYETKKTG
jgi:phage-related protein